MSHIQSLVPSLVHDGNLCSCARVLQRPRVLIVFVSLLFRMADTTEQPLEEARRRPAPPAAPYR